MKHLTVDDIMAMEPCDSWPRERVESVLTRPMTVPEVLRLEHVSPRDRLWVALTDGVTSERPLGLFACDCAKRALAPIENPDHRVAFALDAAIAHVEGTASDLVIEKHCDAAFDVVFDAADDSERHAAKTVAYCCGVDRLVSALYASEESADLHLLRGHDENDELRIQCKRLADIIEAEAAGEETRSGG